MIKKKKLSILRQTYINDPIWKSIYLIEDKINDIIFKTYYGRIIARYEIDDLYTIKIQFKIEKDEYEYMISKRKNDFGFSIYSLDNDKMFNYNIINNQTIENNKFYLYNIYKRIFNVIGCK
jgi:hypothetical protein